MFGEEEKFNLRGKKQFHCELDIDEMMNINKSGIKRTYIVQMGMEYIRERGAIRQRIETAEKLNQKFQT